MHFAVHGKAIPEIPQLSALILSISKDKQIHDTFLHLENIAKLKLKADFVNLSACESRLGRIYAGKVHWSSTRIYSSILQKTKWPKL
ncbi:CHAT domain-containing protein [Candidatus Uabimicrobium sp. HlEnr_7]|uniref:CHAT domain-containing protein n=1 Tax=Candidatus Uabimicrobium helgolandensis TaxID=3095367 RepID=UPI003557AF41